MQQCERDIHFMKVEKPLTDPSREFTATLTNQPHRVVFWFSDFRRDSVDDAEAGNLLQWHLGPPAAFGDADGDDVEPLTIDCAKDTSCRQAGDAVFRRFTTEHQGDLGAFRHFWAS